MAATTSSSSTPASRPVSTVELLSEEHATHPPPLLTAAGGGDFASGGFSNGGFELSSPLKHDVSFQQALLDGGRYHVQQRGGGGAGSQRQSLNLDEIREEQNCCLEDSDENSSNNASSSTTATTTTTAMVHVDDNQNLRGRDRYSWGESCARSHDDWRRRRKTTGDAAPAAPASYSYHQDYQEALSSLLWEPYECRTTTPSLHDADVSLWLQTPPARRDSPPASRTSSTSSVSSAASWRLDKEASWRLEQQDCTSSAACCSNNNNSNDNSGVLEVFDLAASRRSLPPGALVSAAAPHQQHTRAARHCCDLQSEANSGVWRTRRDDANMLVTVATAAGVSDTGGGGGIGASPTSAMNADRVSVTNNNNNNNCYRAVPVVVSSVPSISCQTNNNNNNNSNVSNADNVSNVHIVQTSAPAVMMLTCASETNNNLNRGCARTFASTEAQTDEVPASAEAPEDSNNVASNNREQRRRERRERRHQRRAITNHNHINHEQLWATHQLVESAVAAGQQGVAGERLPDILHSHLPPPYSTLPLGLPPGLVHPQVLVSPPPPVAAAMPSPVLPVIQVHTGAGVRGGSPPPPQAGIRFPFQVAPTGRRRSRRTPRGPHYTPEEEPKSCCGVIVTQTVSIRWFIVMIAFVGICCAVVGTVLGAMKASGREHLTVSLLMIGVGIVLITVSGVAWRLTAHDAPSCRVMLGLSRGEEGVAEPNRRFVPRLPPSYGRPHHPYAAMMYPEFQYRPPPPSYQASMQEYRLRLLLLDRHATPGHAAPSGTALSPPPTYRSHPGGTLRAALNAPHAQQDFSRPPSYRSRTSSARPTLDPNGNLSNTPVHSRDASLSVSETCGGSAVNVISVHGTDPESLDGVKMVPDQDLPLRMMLEKGSGSTTDLGKDGNLVTIVSTGNDSSPVIVTVSGSTTTTCGSTSQGMDAEMEILAHL